MAASPLDVLLQCPACRAAPLSRRAEFLVCGSCSSRYPTLAGIPWLFADPDRALGEWRNRLTLYLEEFGAATRGAEADLAESIRPTTRARLTRLRDAYRAQSRLVAALLQPLNLVTMPLAQAAQQAFASRLPMGQDLHSYYANLHRDWVWGTEENEQSLALVAAALGAGRERVLVLGAGACRLSFDLHQQASNPLTIALDINPLLLFAAQQIIAGQSVALFEFPLAPRGIEDVAVERQLRAPAAARAGLELLFADAWQAPFAPQSFDGVITPWLVDIVDLDFASIAMHVNRLLVPGGRWVNFGSLAFPWRRPALRLSREELEPVLVEAGFKVDSVHEQNLPYMHSPASRHSRREQVLVFAADKQKRAPREPAATGLPPWLSTHSLPIVRSPSLITATDASRIQGVLLALIDGRRSVNDLVQIVSEQGLLPADQARSAVCGLLERLHGSSERWSAAT